MVKSTKPNSANKTLLIDSFTVCAVVLGRRYSDTKLINFMNHKIANLLQYTQGSCCFSWQARSISLIIYICVCIKTYMYTQVQDRLTEHRTQHVASYGVSNSITIQGLTQQTI